MRGEALASYPLVRVAQRPIESLYFDVVGVSRVDHAKLYEAVMLRNAVEALPQSIAEGFDRNVEYLEAGFGQVTGAIDDLAERLEAGLLDLSYTIEQGFERLSEIGQRQLDRLAAIERLLENPLDTASRELRRRGLRAYEFGLHDEAQVDLAEALTTNPYDYVCHLHNGHIHLLKEEHLQASEAYEKAIRYALAPPEGDPERSEFLGSMAHLGLARVYSQGVQRKGARSDSVFGTEWSVNYDQAAEHASAAVRLAPHRADVHYERARVAALRGDEITAANEFTQSLQLGAILFLVVAAAEREVTLPIRPAEEIRKQAYQTARKLDELSDQYETAARRVSIAPASVRRLADVPRPFAVSDDGEVSAGQPGAVYLIEHNAQVASQLRAKTKGLMGDLDRRKSQLSSDLKKNREREDTDVRNAKGAAESQLVTWKMWLSAILALILGAMVAAANLPPSSIKTATTIFLAPVFGFFLYFPIYLGWGIVLSLFRVASSVESSAVEGVMSSAGVERKPIQQRLDDAKLSAAELSSVNNALAQLEDEPTAVIADL